MRPLPDRATLGWVAYDWANSAFVTAVVAGLFPVWFKQHWASRLGAVGSTAALGAANSAAALVVAMCAPVVGAWADARAWRKRLLLAFAGLGALATAGLVLPGAGQWQAAVLLYVVAQGGFSLANTCYDALLPYVAHGRQDVVSAWGYGAGYLGGGLLLAACVGVVSRPALLGLAGTHDAMRASFLLVALWWVTFSLPLLWWTPEPKVDPRGVTGANALARVTHTVRSVRRFRVAATFLLAYWLYIDGVDTVVRMAVDYGLSLGLPWRSLIQALLVTQFIGLPCSVAFGHLGARWGAKKAILLGIGVYLLVCVQAARMRSQAEFFSLAVLIGMVQGGLQALSRSLYSQLIPLQRSAEFFGFYNTVGKFAAVLGPGLMGATAWGARTLGAAPPTASRASILVVALLLAAGGILLSRVPADQARHARESQG